MTERPETTQASARNLLTETQAELEKERERAFLAEDKIVGLRCVLLWVDNAIATGRPVSVIRNEIAKFLHEQ